MNEGGESPEVRKSESPEDSLKPKVESPKSVQTDFLGEEENKSAADSHRDEIPQSELNKSTGQTKSEIIHKSDPDSYRDENPNSEINMEVHHHPHVEKKSFKEYVLEGLMIFLAVFMGFIAENIREHVADGQRESQYMESLVKDLKLDTATLNLAASLKQQRSLAIDSIVTYFRVHRNASKVPVSTFRQMRRAQWDQFFIHHSGTIDQLRNSGGLRLIHEKRIVDSIEHYYQRVQRSESRNTVYFDNQQVSDALSEKLWDAYDNIKYNQDYIFAHKPLPDTGWVAVNTAYLNEYLNNLLRIKWITYSDRVQFTIQLKNNAANLIGLIKKEYQLDE